MFQILVVEDDASLRKLMSAALKQHGYVTFLANDGLEALDVLEKTNIDLIISDIMMPNMDGYEATKCIRHLQDIKKAEIPIIAMTANAFQEDAEKCIAIEMNAHLAKPLDIEKMEQTICKQLRDVKIEK